MFVQLGLQLISDMSMSICSKASIEFRKPLISCGFCLSEKQFFYFCLLAVFCKRLRAEGMHVYFSGYAFVYPCLPSFIMKINSTLAGVFLSGFLNRE